jgi:Spy/CpxP family protein refolding chaperone
VKRSSFISVAALYLALGAASTSAQVLPPDGQRAGAVRPGGARVDKQRAVLERQFRERTAELVRRQLQLNDDQMARLKAANSQFEPQRVALMTQERQARQALRAEMLKKDAANQQRVGSLLDQLISLQRQRVDLLASEQRELGKFMTPVQRAKYFALQGQMRKKMQEVRGRPGAGQGQPPLGRTRPRRNFR